jgi:hypothetical protein
MDEPAAAQVLRELYLRNGHVRRKDPVRAYFEDAQSYRKGEEVRLTANSMSELRMIRRLLRAAGFRLGRPFAKGRQHRQPIYGHDQVERFLDLIGL